jgi:hypothetical protein
MLLLPHHSRYFIARPARLTLFLLSGLMGVVEVLFSLMCRTEILPAAHHQA